jgi:LCP family protein required for cell wall assembly
MDDIPPPDDAPQSADLPTAPPAPAAPSGAGRTRAERRAAVSNGRWRGFGGRLLIGIVIGTVLMTSAVLGVNREVNRRVDSIPKLDLKVAPVPPGGANFLVVGSDTRAFVDTDQAATAFGDAGAEGGQRSDTIMIVHVEPEASRSLVVSFPRDLWVNIPGHGYAKINAAYNYGPQTLIDTIQQNFGVEINHYVELDFQSFIDLVDALGGATVYVPYEAQDEYTGLGLPNGGCWTFDGMHALQWVRSRSLQYRDAATGRWVYADVIPDIGRIGRQQDFIRLLVGLSVQKSLSNPFTANLVADSVVKNLKVDDGFDRTSIFALIDAFRTIDANDASALEFATMPWKTGPNQGAQSVLYANMDLAAPLLARLNTFDKRPKPVPDPATIRVKVINQSGRPELGVAVKQRLVELGFPVVDVVETSVVTPTGPEIRYAPDQAAKAKLLIRYIEPQAVLGGLDPALTAAGADVSLTLTKTFDTIVVPADRLQVTETTLDPAAAPVDTAVIDAPIAQAPVPTAVQLGDPAPRLGC